MNETDTLDVTNQPPVKHDARRQVLRSMPRRKALPVEEGVGAPPERISGSPLRYVSWPRALARLVLWGFVAIGFLFAHLTDRITGRASPRRQALRIRRTIERMGPVTVKIGLSVAGRVDLFGPETADALTEMVDRARPIALDDALERIEHAVGRPLDEVFEAIDPEPIISSSTLTAYQAVLIGEQRVVIKVRKPNIGRELAAEGWALQTLLRGIELLTVGNSALRSSIGNEIEKMIRYELDFRQTARFHRLFNREVGRSKLGHRYRATEVHAEYSTSEVMVVEFASGFWLSEVIHAVQTGDTEFLERLAEQDIEPRKLARRLVQLGWWSLFETHLFFAEPLPNNIVVQPHNCLTLVNLGDNGQGTLQNRELQERLFDCLARDDVSGAVEAYLHWIAPLPLIDIVDFRKRLEGALWTPLFALRDPQSPAPLRSSRYLWRALAHESRDAGVPVPQDVSQRIRASLLYDDLAVRLYPKLKLLDEYDRYQRSSGRRRLRRWQKDRRKSAGTNEARTLALTMVKVSSMAERAAFLFQVFTRQIPPEFQPMAFKGAYVTVVVIRTLSAAFALLTLACGLLYCWNWSQGLPLDLLPILQRILLHPLTWGIVAIGVVMVVRHVGVRLDDKDYD